MKTALIAVVFLVLGLGWTSEAVQVQEGGMYFSLEAVKRLQELTNKMLTAKNPHARPSTSLCLNPLLPMEFKQLCKQKGGSASVARLALIPVDVCEICSFAACTGC
ncbi:unnamed protein product [Knipowitschia caucasica]